MCWISCPELFFTESQALPAQKSLMVIVDSVFRGLEEMCTVIVCQARTRIEIGSLRRSVHRIVTTPQHPIMLSVLQSLPQLPKIPKLQYTAAMLIQSYSGWIDSSLTGGGLQTVMPQLLKLLSEGKPCLHTIFFMTVSSFPDDAPAAALPYEPSLGECMTIKCWYPTMRCSA